MRGKHGNNAHSHTLKVRQPLTFGAFYAMLTAYCPPVLRRKLFLFQAFLAALAFFQTATLRAQLINVNFTQNSSAGEGGPSPGPTMSGAAVLGAAGNQWNGVPGSGGSGIHLKLSTGAASSVTMSFTSGGGYNVYDYSGSTPFTGTPWNALMETYLYNSGVAQTITLSGLTPNSLYNLVVYNAANSSATGRTTYFTVNNNTQGSTWTGTNNNLAPGIDYTQFATAISDASGSLSITYTGNGTTEGDINGLQLQSSPLTMSASGAGAGVALSFKSFAGYYFQVEYKNQLSDPAWTPLDAPILGNNSILTVNDSPGQTGRFYRVEMSTNGPVFGLLRARGTNIVNSLGAVVGLRGVNLGGWLVMEPWMCPADSGGLPDTYSIIKELDSRFGVATEQSLIRTYQTSWITTTDLNNITNAGLNLVRVPVWWGNFYSITNTTASGWRSDAFAELDWLVTNCAARGIYVVIDMHGVVGGQSTSDDTGEQNVNAYWTNSVDQSETANMWSQIAAHYSTNTTVAGYDLINEPDNAPSTSAVWAAYSSLYNTVRAADPNHIVILEGTFGNWDWSMLPAPSVYGWTNVVYSMHEYQYGGNTSQVEAGSDNQVADFKNHLSWNVPGYIGEWNDMGNGAACYDYSINDYNKAGLSWSMWAYKGTDGLIPDGWAWYDPTYWPTTPNVSTDSDFTITEDWLEWKTTTSFGANSAVGL